MEDLRVWHRRHGRDLVAEVTPAHDTGAWDICVYREPGHLDLADDTVYGDLLHAQREADALLRATFDHRCGAACGAWVERERHAHEARR